MGREFKLIYFNGRGRAETIRMLFAASETDYIDERIPYDGWEKGPLKPTMPGGHLPALVVDGFMFGQSNAIARFVSREVGLEGKTDLEQAQVDYICDCLTDMREEASHVKHITDKVQKGKVWREFLQNYPVILRHLQKELEKNNGGTGYFVGDELTRADLHLFTCTESVFPMLPNMLKDFPLLNDLRSRVENDAKVAKYLTTRPVTQF